MLLVVNSAASLFVRGGLKMTARLCLVAQLVRPISLRLQTLPRRLGRCLH